MTTTTQAAGRVPGAAVSPLGLFRSKACPTVGDWEIFSLATRDMDLGPTRLGPVTLNRAVIQRSLRRRLVHHWREGRGGRMTGDVIELHASADSRKTNRINGGLVRAITPILPGEPKAEAGARARRFPPASADRPHRFIPE